MLKLLKTRLFEQIVHNFLTYFEQHFEYSRELSSPLFISLFFSFNFLLKANVLDSFPSNVFFARSL